MNAVLTEPTTSATTEWVALNWGGQEGQRRVHIEHQWLRRDDTASPLLVFLHEGLGSVSLWRDFPQALCDALQCRGLVYSRPGYGQSTSRPAHERLEPDFMHRQACEVLPALLNALGVDTATHKPWLFGHSDGGSIALLYAAKFPDQLAGAVVLAPHILVEDISVSSIQQARTAYAEGDLRQRLSRHHADPDSAFKGWNDIWLNPTFRDWNITQELKSISCPLLAVQGVNDEYGTLEQIRGIARVAPQCKLVTLADCGHSPHRDQKDRLIEAVRDFFSTTALGDNTMKTTFFRTTLIATAAALLSTAAVAQTTSKLKVGLMLPYTGTFASLGTAIENGFRLYLTEQGGKIAGREVEFVKVDDESDPSKATDNVNKLVKRDNVDVLIGTVHSGVAMAMAKVAKETGTLLIVPNAGADAVTGAMCAPNIFRSSFSNWQPGYAMGEVMAKKGIKKVATITWKYAAGDESVRGFKEAFEKGGGTVVKELSLPFPNVEFQALLTDIAATKPDAVYTFFAGGGAVKFVKDYAAAGLKKTVPLYGSGFLTDGTLDAQGADAEGLFTALHYADSMDIPKDKSFRLAYAKAYKLQPDVYAVQGYDAAQILGIGLKAVNGDTTKKAEFAKAVEAAKIDSPRGTFSLSKAHNPVQDMYLRQVTGKENKLVSVASKALADPARGCKM
jgi:branched-chain amino acid transport system substrate-binding protein